MEPGGSMPPYNLSWLQPMTPLTTCREREREREKKKKKTTQQVCSTFETLFDLSSDRWAYSLSPKQLHDHEAGKSKKENKNAINLLNQLYL